MNLKKTHIEHIMVFGVAFAISAVMLSMFSEIEFTDALWGFLLAKALIVTGLFFAIRKKHAKGGHAALIVGLYLTVLGGGMFAGSFEYQNTNQYGQTVGSERLWELSNTEAGVFIVILIIGILFIIYGLKIALQNVYFWTWKAFVVMFAVIAIVGIIIYTTFF